MGFFLSTFLVLFLARCASYQAWPIFGKWRRYLQQSKYAGARKGPPPTPPNRPSDHLRIAVIGAGITGIGSACYALDSGCECHIFEANSAEKGIGGIWTRVNDTSTLQIHSQFYTFHTSVRWNSDYPSRREILTQARRLWNQYRLQDRSTFDVKVTRVYREAGKWVINDPSYGYFDGVVAATGTCGDIKLPNVLDQDQFDGIVRHSSQLGSVNMSGKNVVVIGGGASAVEALEYAYDRGAASVRVITRSDKWFIPRHPRLNMCFAALIGDRFGVLAMIIEWLLRRVFYREFAAMAPPVRSDTGIFSSTPIVNNRVFKLLREGRATWTRGHVNRFVADGVLVSPPAGKCNLLGGDSCEFQPADVCIFATGYRRPSLNFLEQDALRQSKHPDASDWYLQVFRTPDVTFCATNATFVDGIATVGGHHIGVYMRYLLVFLMDPCTRPSPWMTQAWAHIMRVTKSPIEGGPLAFVTLAELYVWFLFTLSQPHLWKWATYILLGHMNAVRAQGAKMPSDRKATYKPRDRA